MFQVNVLAAIVNQKNTTCQSGMPISCAYIFVEGGVAVHHKITTLEYTVYSVEHCQRGPQMRGCLTKYFHSDFQFSAKA